MATEELIFGAAEYLNAGKTLPGQKQTMSHGETRYGVAADYIVVLHILTMFHIDRIVKRD